VLIRQLEYLVALAREKHFARAAQSCWVSQPTLSEGISRLEADLGVALVHRGRRYEGLTPEGDRLVGWARRVLAERDTLLGELRSGPGSLTGRVRLGAIPTSLPPIPSITEALLSRHPDLTVTVHSLNSAEITRRVEAFELDGGLTYFDPALPSHLRHVPLYEEHYLLLTPGGGPLKGRASASWAEAAKLPLCLLTPDMQNRRIIDRALRSVGAEATPTLTSNSLLVLYTHVKTGRWASVMPAKLAETLGLADTVRSIPIVDPVVTYSIGLVVPQRDPMTPLIAALVHTAREVAPTLES
jgi:DNA-binding transcriptional LysR family regulator